MINAQMRFYHYFTFGDKDKYGQAKLSEEPKGQIKMCINISSQATQDNIIFENCKYIGLTYAPIDATYVIQYGDEKLKVLYVNPMGRLEKLGEVPNLEEAVGKACALIERSAKEKAPKDTGALRRSITSKIEGSGADIQGIVYTPLEYAPYIEYGTGLFAESGGRKDVPWCYQDDKGEWHSTSGIKPQPFMRPAINENREEVLRILKEAISGND